MAAILYRGIWIRHADIEWVRYRVTSTASLDDGYCEAAIPVVKEYHVT